MKNLLFSKAAIFLSFLSAVDAAGSRTLTVPLKRKQLDQPVTNTQKILSDFFKKEMIRKAQS